MGLGGGFDYEVVEQRPGIIIFRVSGRGAARAFAREAGGHRWQRVPKTEKRGRRQTSTVTVAVLREPTEVEVRLDPKDLDIRTCRGSGAGGQHRNRTESAVQVTHTPTGIQVRCESERSQHQNKETALGVLRARLLEAKQHSSARARDNKRRNQVGSGMRGDKIRTVAVHRDQVTDHQTGKQIAVKDYLRGNLDGLK